MNAKKLSNVNIRKQKKKGKKTKDQSRAVVGESSIN